MERRKSRPSTKMTETSTSKDFKLIASKKTLIYFIFIANGGNENSNA